MVRTWCSIGILAGLLALQHSLNGAAAASMVSGTAGSFSITISCKASEDDSPVWAFAVKGRFFAGGRKLMAEGEYALPGGQSKERIGLFVDGSRQKFYLLFPDTLNYQELRFEGEHATGFATALPELARLSYPEVKKLMASLGMKLHPLGKRRLEAQMLDAFTVKFANGSLRPSEVEPRVHLYFQPETHLLRVLNAEAADKVLYLVLTEARKAARSEAELRLPKDYYPLAARQLGPPVQEKVNAGS